MTALTLDPPSRPICWLWAHRQLDTRCLSHGRRAGAVTGVASTEGFGRGIGGFGRGDLGARLDDVGFGPDIVGSRPGGFGVVGLRLDFAGCGCDTVGFAHWLVGFAFDLLGNHSDCRGFGIHFAGFGIHFAGYIPRDKNRKKLDIVREHQRVVAEKMEAAPLLEGCLGVP